MNLMSYCPEPKKRLTNVIAIDSNLKVTVQPKKLILIKMTFTVIDPKKETTTNNFLLVQLISMKLRREFFFMRK